MFRVPQQTDTHTDTLCFELHHNIKDGAVGEELANPTTSPPTSSFGMVQFAWVVQFHRVLWKTINICEGAGRENWSLDFYSHLAKMSDYTTGARSSEQTGPGQTVSLV